ncbi:EAL domain-containing protein [Corallincola platygyrae]|uniref:EAL domain-containing protein n=1 Tax=Corallincola platygyrae TaxID=1193278 RepID=A0ABW4XNN5_9GAMM
MTLSRQLLQLITLLLGLMLLASWLIYLQSARSDIQKQLGNHAQDTATALSLTLVPYTSPWDSSAIEATITALYDRGYFSQISIHDNEGKLIAERRSSPLARNGTPNWFKQLYPLTAPSKRMELSDGWRVTGRVEVTADLSAAYQRLWITGWKFILAGAVIFVVAIIGALLLVKRLLKPLQMLQQKAAEIAEGKFHRLKTDSGTREINSLIESFNQMSGTLQTLFSGLEEKASQLQAQAYLDDETGLGNRRAFLAELNQMTQTEQACAGCVLLIKLELDSLYQSHGYQAVTQLWRQLAPKLMSQLKESQTAFRVHDEEVTILMPQADRAGAERLANSLLTLLNELDIHQLEHGLGGIGLCYFRPKDQQDQILSELDLAVQHAQQQGKFSLYFNTGNRELPTVLLTNQGRQKLVDAIIQEQRFEFKEQAIKRLDKDSVVYKEWLPRFADLKGHSLPPGTILTLARQCERLPALEMGIGKEAISFAKQQNGQLALNIDPVSLQDETFLDWLVSHCKADEELAQRLTLELDERRLTPNYEAIAADILRLEETGVSFAIDHFGAGTASFSLLTAMKPKYLKLDGRFTHQLPLLLDHQFFIQTLLQLCRGLNTKVIALEIEKQEDLAMLRQLGVEMGQGYLLNKPTALATASAVAS